MQILVIRTSAMGDVALTVPVLKEFMGQYPGHEIILVTRHEFKPFFSSIEGIKFIFLSLNEDHRGLYSILSLYNEIKREHKIDHVIDLHDVLRSKILRFLFRISGVPVAVIDKGRKEKRELIKGGEKIQLKHTVNRYSDVFAKAGFPLPQMKNSGIISSDEALKNADLMVVKRGELNIGVAPFAKHKLKVWPEENMIKLLAMINEKHKSKFWLFGSRDEAGKIESLHSRVPRSVNLAGSLSLEDELALMRKLDFMIAMDSSNMHMAALAGTKVISIWGGTDPLTGFGAWNQPEDFSMRIPVDELTCRPCTVFGKGECARGDFACMHWLTAEKVFKKLTELKVI
jgi:ADP-heptose:LPS heptosyltransferase